MTLLDDPPVDDAVPSAARVDRADTSTLAGWRLATRLARREVRRRPGRTVLVTALVVLPIAAMTLALALAGTVPDTLQESFERWGGQADITVNAQDDVESTIAQLPGGSRAVVDRSFQTSITAADGEVVPWVSFRVLPFGDPLIDGLIEIDQGRAPTTADEVILGPELAAALGVTIGDTLTLERPSGSWEVVGIGRSANYGTDSLFGVTSFDDARVRPEYRYATLLVDLPDGFTRAGLEAISPADVDWSYSGPSPDFVAEIGWTDYRNDGDLPVEAMAWGWVAGTIALAAVGVVIAAAFATSARRQLATIGQLAANGASERLVRRTLGLQGAWTGLIGAVVGIGIGLVVLPFTRPLIEQLVDHDIGPWVVEWWALVVILATGVLAATIAALVPARSAARIPVLAALAGRRPLAPAPRRLIPIGVVLFLGGVALLVLVTVASTNDMSGRNENAYAAAAVIGGLAVVAGMCCASPIAIDLIGRVGGRLGGTWRLAVRSVARSRTRSAGVLTAIAVTGTAAIAITTAIGSLAFGDEDEVRYLPTDAAVLEAIRFDDTPASTAYHPESAVTAEPISPTIERRFREILPDATFVPRTIAVADTVDLRTGSSYLLLADETTIDLLGLSEQDQQALNEIGMLSTGFAQDATGQRLTTILVPQSNGNTIADIAIPQDPLASRAGYWGAVITPERAGELGLHTIDVGIVAVNTEPFTERQRDQLSELQGDLWASSNLQPDAFLEPGDQPTPAFENGSWVDARAAFGSDSVTFPRALLDAAAVTAALVLTLLVVAIGLALAATDSRDERDVLVAVGSKPRTLRGLAATKAVVLTVCAAVLAIPTGFIPVAAIITAAPEDDTVTFPWLTALGLLVVVPVIAGLAALATSALAQRVKPVTMSTLAFD